MLAGSFATWIMTRKSDWPPYDKNAIPHRCPKCGGVCTVLPWVTVKNWSTATCLSCGFKFDYEDDQGKPIVIEKENPEKKHVIQVPEQKGEHPLIMKEKSEPPTPGSIERPEAK